MIDRAWHTVISFSFELALPECSALTKHLVRKSRCQSSLKVDQNKTVLLEKIIVISYACNNSFLPSTKEKDFFTNPLWLHCTKGRALEGKFKCFSYWCVGWKKQHSKNFYLYKHRKTVQGHYGGCEIGICDTFCVGCAHIIQFLLLLEAVQGFGSNGEELGREYVEFIFQGDGDTSSADRSREPHEWK